MKMKKQGKLSDFANIASDNPFKFGKVVKAGVRESRRVDRTIAIIDTSQASAIPAAIIAAKAKEKHSSGKIESIHIVS